MDRFELGERRSSKQQCNCVFICEVDHMVTADEVSCGCCCFGEGDFEFITRTIV